MASGNSLNAMIAAVTYELGSRSDLQANGTVLRYIQNAIEIYQKERFRFNELLPLTPFSLVTVQGRAVYNVGNDPRIPLLYKIDYINYQMGTVLTPIGLPQKMQRVFPEEIYLSLDYGSQSGPPLSWAWDGQAIVIYPIPSATSYVLQIGGYLAVAGPTDAAATDNVWMNDAEQLIRSRAKYEIALHVTRNKDMMAAMSPDEGSGGASERAYNTLKSEANKIRGTSRIRPMPF